ncbi:VWA domain-containing protein [Thiorhodovibrio winogradskyi]|nr:VWA domain-containing protein [Thiorhodovibrio winogradskyi]
MPSDFHFLNPWWLLALLPLAPILWFGATDQSNASSAWRRVIDARLLPVLTLQPAKLNPLAARLPLVLLALGWLIAVLALANPTFERKPVPTFSGGRDRVVVLDLSRSMEAADLTPSRLARARYKVADILARVRDGRVGLIAFAGDAFTVAPLTQDADTILAMLEALQTEIMPVPGSRPDLALKRAGALLEQSGATKGEVVLISDDAGDQRARAAAEALKAQGHRLAVIGVGTAEGAPVPGVRRADGPVITKLDAEALRALARAGGGSYAGLTSDDLDLNSVLSAPDTGGNLPAELTESQIQAWYPLGPWVALALLPLAALAFRRGWLLVSLPLLIGSMLVMAPADPAHALGWDDLWLRRDQQAAQALAQGEPERARELAPDPQRRGTAAYRAGDYQAAAEDFSAGETATDHYNRGNALARAGELEDALAAYEEALALQGVHQDARHNHAQVKKLLEQRQQEQQQQQQDQQQDQEDNEDGESGEESPDRSQSQSQNQDENQEQSQNQSGQSQDGQPQDGESSDDNQARNEQSEPKSSDNQSSENGEQDSESPQDSQSSDQEQPRPSGDGRETDSSNQQASNNEIEPGRDRQAEQQAAEDYREAAQAAEAKAKAEAEAEAEAEKEQDRQQAATASQTAEGTPEEREARAAAEQWLRRIPDDPAGLLRRKFLYQYSQRVGPEQNVAAGEPW